MAEHSDVRQAFYAALKTFADAQSPALRICVKGLAFTPADRETYLKFHFVTRKPSKPYAGAASISKEGGFFQVDCIVPESRLEKAAEQLAWDVREHFWPSSADFAPTLGSNPLIRLGPAAPHVHPHPAPDTGTLAHICEIDWHSDFPRT